MAYLGVNSNVFFYSNGQQLICPTISSAYAEPEYQNKNACMPAEEPEYLTISVHCHEHHRLALDSLTTCLLAKRDRAVRDADNYPNIGDC